MASGQSQGQKQERPKAKGPRNPIYGDPSFKGLGIIKCGVCKDPLRDHDRIGPCPNLPKEARLTTPKKAPGTHPHWEKENEK